MNELKEYFKNLEARERNLVIIAGLLLALIIPYQFMWKPLSESVINSNIRVQAQKKQFSKMQQQAKKIQALRGAGVVASQPGRQFLNNAINTAARKNGLSNALKIKSDSNNNLRVSMDNVPFDNVMDWLDQLISQNGVLVSKVNIDRQPTIGRVNVSVYLEAP